MRMIATAAAAALTSVFVFSLYVGGIGDTAIAKATMLGLFLNAAVLWYLALRK
jgi:hypothetical protein